MRAVVQRVSKAEVTVDGASVGKIGHGQLILVGVGQEDDESDAKWLAEKCVSLRIFNDGDGKMNCSLKEVNGNILVVSQFTLYGDCRKGRRPSFVSSAAPEKGNELYEKFCGYLRAQSVHVETGQFQADMQVDLVNEGPVTLLLDSKKQF